MPKWLPISLVIALFLAGVYLIMGDNCLRDVYQTKQELAAMNQQLADLTKEKAEFQERIERLQSDPVAIEREVRKRLKYVRADETVFIVKPNEAGAP